MKSPEEIAKDIIRTYYDLQDLEGQIIEAIEAERKDRQELLEALRGCVDGMKYAERFVVLRKHLENPLTKAQSILKKYEEGK